jgi:hypothetical protein
MHEIMFSSVKDAVRWSEETALMTDIQSSMKLLTSSGGTQLSRSEAVDIAQTVTLITANCKPFKGMAVKAVYSSCSTKFDDRDLGIGIAANLLNMESAMDKNTRQLIALGVGAVETMRSIELYGRRYPVKKVAKSVGVSRETFCRGKAWINLRSEAKERLESWVRLAEIEIFSELNNLGWMM